MSNEVEDEEHDQMIIRAITDNNVKKLEKALGKTKKHGKGFVLSSHLSRNRHRYSPPQGLQRPMQPQIPIVIGSPLVSPTQLRKTTPAPENLTPPSSRARSAGNKKRKEKPRDSPRPHSAYLTEIRRPWSSRPKPVMVDMAIQSNGPDQVPSTTPPATPEHRSECGERIIEGGESLQPGTLLASQKQKNFEEKAIEDDDTARQSPLKDSTQERVKRKERRISDAKFEKLGISRRPRQFQYEATVPKLCIKSPDNPEPLRSNIWVTMVPKSGAELKTPFYAQLDIPDGALRDDAIMKFETQSYENAGLVLSPEEKLCTQIVDVNMTPLAYCLHQEAVVRMRILEECVNDHESITIVRSRHFNWARVPTVVETKEVHGEKHYYAVSRSQYLGKFAVITSQKMDRFVMTSAGGTFKSTISPDVTFKLQEGLITDIAHMVELSVKKTRSEAIESTSKDINSVRGIRGHLVASSHLVEISKEVMGKSGLLHDGVSLPSTVNLTLPVTGPKADANNKDNFTQLWKNPTIRIMKKTQVVKEEPAKTLPSFIPGVWEDITALQSCEPDPQQLKNSGSVGLTAPLPSQVVVLVFDETQTRKQSLAVDAELNDVCNTLLQNNNFHKVGLMVHQRTDQPEVISVHAVPVAAAELIAGTMAEGQEWKLVDNTLFQEVHMEERGYLNMRFIGPFRPTINQIDPIIQFHSRRWQGYQYQVECTEESYSNNSKVTMSGTIQFVQKLADEEKVVHTCAVTVPRNRAKPYKPLIVARPVPRVTVYREYKLAWMKNLTAAEKKKYQEINTP